MTLHRRDLLVRGLGALGGAAWLASSASARVRAFGAGDPADPRTLVLLQLAGGNDGLSTVVPHGDDVYHRTRRSLALPSDEVLKIDDYRGLHPTLAGLRRVYDQGRLAIVEGVGYPDPNRSHFKSFEIWHAADPRGRAAGEGWVGRLCDAAWPQSDAPELTVHIGKDAPFSLHSASHPPVSFQTPAGYRWVGGSEADQEAYRKAGEAEEPESGSASVLARLRGKLRDAQDSSRRIRRAAAVYEPKIDYPGGDFGNALRCAAALVNGGMGTRVVSVELGGFDTHNGQAVRYQRLMQQLDWGLTSFLDDLTATEAGRNTVVLVFSEFGRRVAENGSRGTDHGTAGPAFLAGWPVKGGLYGEHPSLEKLDAGDLVHTTDFRSLYATVIERWFGADSTEVLDGRFAPLDALPKA